MTPPTTTTGWSNTGGHWSNAGAGRGPADSAQDSAPRVPTIDDDGFILSESMAINLPAKWPHVHAWLNRCWERPAAKAARAMREKAEKHQSLPCTSEFI